MSTAACDVQAPSRDPDIAWRLLGLVVLGIRLVQGWIFRSGGSWRFLYAPAKLDPSSYKWMANKLQGPSRRAFRTRSRHRLAAAPCSFAPGHPDPGALELISGLGLLTGTLTRLSALISIGLSAALMPIFGWQGHTCIDEWTTSASNFAMGAVIFTASGGAWSVDHWLMRRYPFLANRPCFR